MKAPWTPWLREVLGEDIALELIREAHAVPLEEIEMEIHKPKKAKAATA